MSSYVHKVNYYETDKMGITHHSNYIRFMEEARMNFLTEIGYPLTRMEAAGITSPVVSVNCEYRETTTFSDDIEIHVSVTGYTGVRLKLGYTMWNKESGELVAKDASTHCFLNKKGKPVALKRYFRDLDDMLSEPCED